MFSKGEAVTTLQKYADLSPVPHLKQDTQVHSERETQEDFVSELFVDAVTEGAEEDSEEDEDSA